MALSGEGKRFLFLQGPHGPFFWRLGNMLAKTGAQIWRVGFNTGDDAFWFSNDNYIPFQDAQDNWAAQFRDIVSEKSITDLVLYGDTRPVHAQAVEIARGLNLRIHVFEEGYLRPYWVTYERNGSNGHSKLMDMNVPQMRKALEGKEQNLPPAPASWGDMRQHIFYGMLYHYFVFLRNGKYRNFRPHRSLTVAQEFILYLKRLTLMPATAIQRSIATRRIRSGGFPFHLALLQLEHDASFQMHSSFETMTDFLDLTIEGFAKGAASHHHLVFKAHPLEDGRVNLRAQIRAIAKKHGVSRRVHFVRGGKLAMLLDGARSAITVNSTAAQQALWRGLPLKAFGDAVYNKPEFVSDQPIAEFFARPTKPDIKAYRDYRHYLLETSQVPGGFYSARGRRQLLREVTDMMLRDEDPYDGLMSNTATRQQQLKVVS